MWKYFKFKQKNFLIKISWKFLSSWLMNLLIWVIKSIFVEKISVVINDILSTWKIPANTTHKYTQQYTTPSASPFSSNLIDVNSFALPQRVQWFSNFLFSFVIIEFMFFILCVNITKNKYNAIIDWLRKYYTKISPTFLSTQTPRR